MAKRFGRSYLTESFDTIVMNKIESGEGSIGKLLVNDEKLYEIP